MVLFIPVVRALSVDGRILERVHIGTVPAEWFRFGLVANTTRITFAYEHRKKSVMYVVNCDRTLLSAHLLFYYE